MKKERTVHSRALRAVLREYWTQYKTKPVWALIAFLMPAFGTILTSFIPPLILAKIIDIFVAQNAISLHGIGTYIALFGTIWFLGEIFWRIGFHYLIKLEVAGMNQLGNDAFTRLEDRDYDFYSNNFVGSLSKKALAFSKNFESFTDTLAFNIIMNLIPIVFSVVILWRYSMWIPIILVGCLGLVIAIAIPIVRKRQKLVALRHAASSAMVGRLSDALTNMLAIKSFAKEEHEFNEYKKYTEDFGEKYRKAANYHNLNFDTKIAPLYVGTNLFGLVSAIFFAGRFGIPAGAIVVVFSYYAQITRMFWEINRTYRNLESSVSEAAEFTELFLEAPAIADAPDATELKVTDAKISFNNAVFAYGSEENMFLRDFNLTIDSKQKIGLVGPSGGGKTTITKLLLRFVDLNEGSITIDGQDIKKVTQTSLRRAIAYVPQEPLLFHRSLYENIAYGNDHATKEDVIKAAKLAHAHEFISTLPLGYDTLVGERGIKLSGGQRQRVAIARSILKDAPILVLDEATSALDSESEKYIQEGFKELMKNKTTLVIAHRLSTIKHLDRILVLDNGKIVEDGTHEELIKKPRGLYAKLWGHQSGEFLKE